MRNAAPSGKGSQRLDTEMFENVDAYIKRLIRKAQETQETVEGSFNGIPLIVQKDSTAEDLQRQYSEGLRKSSEAYMNSPSHKAWLVKDEKRKQKAVLLLKELETLDLGNIRKILKWLMEFQKADGEIKDLVDRQRILTRFSIAGYEPTTDCDTENPESIGRFIIGQGLLGISCYGEVHQAIHECVRQWKEKTKAKTEGTYKN